MAISGSKIELPYLRTFLRLLMMESVMMGKDDDGFILNCPNFDIQLLPGPMHKDILLRGTFLLFVTKYDPNTHSIYPRTIYSLYI